MKNKNPFIRYFTAIFIGLNMFNSLVYASNLGIKNKQPTKYKEFDFVDHVPVDLFTCETDSFKFKHQKYLLSLCDPKEKKLNLNISKTNDDFEFTNLITTKLKNYDTSLEYNVKVEGTDDYVYLLLDENGSYDENYKLKDYKTYVFRSNDLKNWEQVNLPDKFKYHEILYDNGILFLNYTELVKRDDHQFEKFKLGYLNKNINSLEEYSLPKKSNGDEISAHSVRLADDKIFVGNTEYDSTTNSNKHFLYYKHVNSNSSSFDWEQSSIPQSVNSTYKGDQIKLEASSVDDIYTYGNYLVTNINYTKYYSTPEPKLVEKVYIAVSKDGGKNWSLVNFDFNTEWLDFYYYNNHLYVIADEENCTLESCDEEVYGNRHKTKQEINESFLKIIKHRGVKYYILSVEQIFDNDKLSLEPYMSFNNAISLFSEYDTYNPEFESFGVITEKNGRAVVNMYRHD